MEANEYDTDVLLPPRKRLLAGLKRQNSESPSQSSLENPSPSSLSEFDIRLNNLLKSYKNGPHMSPEEIAKAAKSAAIAAAKAAEAARAIAEEKAVVAAKAMAAAKDALSLVASKKSKTKKHVPVDFLYKEHKVGETETCGTDEEMARKLHRAINSSPRILKHSPGSKNKHKKLKSSIQDDGIGIVTGDDMEEEADSEESYEESYVAKVEERMFEPSDGMHSNGRKRGRVKQKKLSLSLCSFKDRANPKDGPNQNSLVLDKSAPSNLPVPPIEPAPTWKCQDFKAPPVH